MREVASGLVEVGGSVYIHGNAKLANLSWLEHVTIGGCLWVMENTRLATFGAHRPRAAAVRLQALRPCVRACDRVLGAGAGAARTARRRGAAPNDARRPLPRRPRTPPPTRAAFPTGVAGSSCIQDSVSTTSTTSTPPPSSLLPPPSFLLTTTATTEEKSRTTATTDPGLTTPSTSIVPTTQPATATTTAAATTAAADAKACGPYFLCRDQWQPKDQGDPLESTEAQAVRDRSGCEAACRAHTQCNAFLWARMDSVSKVALSGRCMLKSQFENAAAIYGKFPNFDFCQLEKHKG